MSRIHTGPLDPERDRDLILANRERIRAELPEAVPFIKDMVAAGLLDGWRSVTWVGDMQEPTWGIDPARWCQPVVYSAEEIARFEKLGAKR